MRVLQENQQHQKEFTFPIPWWDEKNYIIGYGYNGTWIIILDSRQGYHQVSGKKSDRDKYPSFHQKIKVKFQCNDIWYN